MTARLSTPGTRRADRTAAKAVIIAAAICAFATAAPASAASSWSGPVGTVPGAVTGTTPALASVTFGTSPTPSTVVAWKGLTSAGILYESSPTPSVAGSWTAEAAIPGAQASSAPAIASYRDPAGQQALLAIWRGTTGTRIDYAQGVAEADGTISWTAISALPSSEGTTSAAPALVMSASPSLAIIAYRNPHGYIRSVVGTPAGRGFRWAGSEQVATADVSRSGPALAVTPTESDATSSPLFTIVWTGDNGALVINKGLLIDKCPGCPGPGLQWGLSEILANSEHLGDPAVSAIGADLLLAYRSTIANQVMYQTYSGSTWSGPSAVPNAATITGPALLGSQMATVGSADSISLYDYS